MATRIEVITALANRLSQITISNGYFTDSGLKVLVMPDHPISALDYDDIKDGVLSFDFTGEQYVYENQNMRRVLNINIQAEIPYADNQHVKAHEITEDLIRALASPLAAGVKTRLKDSEIGFPSAGSPGLVTVNMTVEVEYITKL